MDSAVGIALNFDKTNASNSIDLIQSSDEIQSAVEKRKVFKLIGWKVNGIENYRVAKKLKDGIFFEIIELIDGNLLYFLKDFHELSLPEAEFFKNALECFQKSNKIRSSRKHDLNSFLKNFCIGQCVELDELQQSFFLKILKLSVFGAGNPLNVLLEDDSLEEISCIGVGEKRPMHVYHKVFGWLSTNLFYADSITVQNAVNRICRRLGRRLSMQTPRLNACLENGARLNASISPVSFFGPNFTIRKFQEKPFTPLDLIENRTVSAKAMAFLWTAMEIDCSVLFIGNTGSGKTTTLNALFSFVPQSERIISVEETPEISLPHSHLIKLNVVESLQIEMHDLVFDTLRMRPDRVIVGEIRNGFEAKAFIDTLLAGQGKGSYATFHAQSAMDGIFRLKNLGAKDFDLAAIDLIVVQRRWTEIDVEKNFRSEIRRVSEICEVSLHDGKLKLVPLFEFCFEKNCLVQSKKSRKIFRKAMNCFKLDESGLVGEILKRENFLKKFSGNKIELIEFFKMVSSGGWKNYGI